jgi:hypothetical protein
MFNILVEKSLEGHVNSTCNSGFDML